MQPTDDSALLRQYADNNSDEAFATLVIRHVNLVYSVALRQVGNPHHAEEITQAVYIILAKKAAQLRHDKALGSWLFQATRLTANNFIRSEARRHRREEEACMQSILNESETEVWTKIAPLLDAAVASLREKDRQAILLRYYEGRNLRDVGLTLGASEDAAEKRVKRALEKLRKFFTKRGVSSTTAIIAGAISANSVQAAPVALAKSVTAVAIAKGAAASGSILILVKGTMKMMTWIKLKFTVAISAVVLVTGGLVTIALSGEKTQQVPLDAVAFFKQAISSPLDVDSFIAGQRSLLSLEELGQLAQLIAQRPDVENKKTPSPQKNLQKAQKMQLEQFYAGARAGSDYYLRYISSPNTPNIPAANVSIIGRAGSVLYQVGRDNVSYGSGTNAFVESVNVSFGLVRLFLDMGLDEIEPESVVWTGNQFTALNLRGHSEYGELEVSNNLPFAIKVYEQKNSPDFKRIEYQYPNPPASFGGFPTKMTIFTVSEGESKPRMEITLYSVHTADRRLPHDFFGDGQFKTAKIIYTNAYINSEVWGMVKKLNGKTYFTNLDNVKVVYPKN
jgi:RNA polymerase sigma factor (sigma-70 family)